MRLLTAILLVFALCLPQSAYSARKKKKKKAPTGVLCLTADNQIKSKKKCKAGEFLLDANGLIALVANNITFTDNTDDSVAAPGEAIRGRLRALFSTPGLAALFSATADLTKLISTLPTQNIIIKLTPELAAACPNLSACLGPAELSNTTNLSSQCTGTFEIPTAPEGKLCIYPGIFSNILDFEVSGLSPSTFFVNWLADGNVNLGITQLDATWSYTEPSSAGATRSSGLRGEIAASSTVGIDRLSDR